MNVQICRYLKIIEWHNGLVVMIGMIGFRLSVINSAGIVGVASTERHPLSKRVLTDRFCRIYSRNNSSADN